jgi:hypothetical protein
MKSQKSNEVQLFSVMISPLVSWTIGTIGTSLLLLRVKNEKRDTYIYARVLRAHGPTDKSQKPHKSQRSKTMQEGIKEAIMEWNEMVARGAVQP